MIVEHLRDGAGAEIYRRFREHGRMAPPGLNYLSSWVTDDFMRCYQVMATDDRDLIDPWIANWNDLEEFDLHPLMTSAEAQARMASPG